MALEVWLVLWAVGEPIGVTEALTVETFARLASMASAAIPANIGALEASNASVVAALGLGGGGTLALAQADTGAIVGGGWTGAVPPSPGTASLNRLEAAGSRTSPLRSRGPGSGTWRRGPGR